MDNTDNTTIPGGIQKPINGTEQVDKTAKPTDDELAVRWFEQHPDTIYCFGGFRRYKNGFWSELPRTTVEIELYNILKEAKSEGVNPKTGGLNSVINFARIEATFPSEKMDKQPNTLVLKNGNLHIPSGEFFDHSRDCYALSSLPYNYQPDAIPHAFLEVLSRLLKDEAEFLQEFAGYCLTQDTHLETAIWLIGPSGSGKSAVITAYKALLGDYAAQLSLSEMERSKFFLPHIVGKKLIYSTEQVTDKPTTLDILNKIVSGETMMIEEKFEPAFQYTPYAKIAWASSKIPHISPEDGFFRRFKFVSMPALPEALRDPNIKEQIKREGPGILNWALEGWKRLYDRGYFEIPQSVKNTTDRIQGKSNPVQSFISDCCEKNSAYRQQSEPLYESYCSWCSEHAHKPLSTVKFAEELETLGYDGPSNGRSSKVKGRRYWYGLKDKRD